MIINVTYYLKLHETIIAHLVFYQQWLNGLFGYLEY
jgi:hypothetical protein